MGSFETHHGKKELSLCAISGYPPPPPPFQAICAEGIEDDIEYFSSRSVEVWGLGYGAIQSLIASNTSIVDVERCGRKKISEAEDTNRIERTETRTHFKIEKKT